MVRGYDNPRFNHELVMDLQFHDGVGALILDWSKSHMAPNTLTGAPTWSFLGNDLTYLDFDSTTPDYIITLAADSGVTNFTSGDFSGAAWIKPDGAGTNRVIFNRGTAATGWTFYVNQLERLTLQTNQVGPVIQYTLSSAIPASVWQFVGFARDGAAVRVYRNGRDVTNYYGTHINPASSNAQNFYIGCGNAVAAGTYLDGGLWRPRVWNRYVTAAEHLAIFETERHLFGV